MKSALLLEDYADTRDWLAELLRSAFDGVEVDEAATIAKARDLLANKQFNLAIIDLNLPDGSGIDFIRELSAASPQTYCVVATISDDDRHLFAALQAGAHGYLLKEQPREALLKRLQGILSGEPPLSPAIARRILRHFHHDMATEKAATGLTAREQEVLALLAKGCKRGEVATLLGISANTAAEHVKSIYRKLNVSTRAEATLEAARMGLVGREAL